MMTNISQPWLALVVACALASFLPIRPAHGAVVSTVLEDNFNNGVVANSDTNAGYWNSTLSAAFGDANSLVESGGVLAMTVGDDDGTNNNNFSGVVIYSDVTSDFNFFNQEFTVSVRGIGFTDNGTPSISGAAQRLRLMLISDSFNSFLANDAVVVGVRGDGTLTLGSKTNAPSSQSEGSTIHEIFLGSGVTGFDFTIGPGTGTNIDYTITVLGGTSGTASGSFVFDVSDWDGAGGNASLGFWTQELNVTGGNQNFTAEIDSVLVTIVVPSPAALPAGLGLGLLGLAAMRHRSR